MASSLNTPDVLTQPIAENGDKNTIPSTNDQSLGQMSQSTGFPAICSERIADGGKAPRRADFNGAFNMLSRYIFFKQNGGIETFRADVSTAIGGYPKDAILGYRTTTEFKLVRSLIANNTYNFNTTPSYIDDGTHWESVIPMSKNIANWSSNVSNCITEIKQDIKLELSSGVLKLKSGSKIYVPNGTNTFDTVTLSEDKTVNLMTTTGKTMVFLRDDESAWGNVKVDNCLSGTTVPSGHTGMFYNTDNNKVYYYSGGQAQGAYFSLPLAVVTSSGGTVTSIDQVFNGFGYIGSTVYALPGIKCLIPDGRNSDGTLKSVVHTTSSVSKLTTAYNATLLLSRVYGISVPYYTNYADDKKLPTYYSNCEWYNPDTNEMYHVGSGAVSSRTYACVCCKTTASGGKITSLEIQYPFRAVDYSDTEFIGHQAMPSDKKLSLTVGVTGTQYTANSDGYFTFSVTPTASNFPCNSTVVIKSSSGTEKYRKVNTVYGSGTSVYYIAPVSKGDIFKLEGLDYGTWQTVEFVYANGSK